MAGAGKPSDEETIDSYYRGNPKLGAKDLRHQRDVLASRNPDTPSWVLGELIKTGNADVLAGLAANAACPRHLLDAVLEQCEKWGPGPRSSYVNRRLAANPLAPGDILDRLLRSGDEDTRLAAAANLGAPEGALRVAAQHDQSPEVRAVATANLNTPPPSESTRKEPDPRVRVAAACRRDVSPGLLDLLAADGDPLVRRAVAANLNTTTETLLNLSADPESESVRATATANPNHHKASPAATGLLK